MPDTPAPQLLSPERLAIITKRLLGPGSASGINEQLDGRALLAHLSAYRLAVAEQLRGLLKPMDGYENSPAGYMEMNAARNHNLAIRAAAKALAIEL